jgi:hypothetical protein
MDNHNDIPVSQTPVNRDPLYVIAGLVAKYEQYNGTWDHIGIRTHNAFVKVTSSLILRLRSAAI